MSAFICSEKHFATTFNYIKDNENLFQYTFESDVAKILEFVNTMIRANHYAVNYRYSERNRGYKLTQADCEKYANEEMSSFQFLKNMHCVNYQMSEGDTDKKFKKMFDIMRKIETVVSYAIITNMSEYDTAKWGN